MPKPPELFQALQHPSWLSAVYVVLVKSALYPVETERLRLLPGEIGDVYKPLTRPSLVEVDWLPLVARGGFSVAHAV
jgi:hypothetical protein